MSEPSSLACKTCNLLSLSPLKPVFTDTDKMSVFRLTDVNGVVSEFNFVQVITRLKDKNEHYLTVAFRRIQRFPKMLNPEGYQKLMHRLFCENGIVDEQLSKLRKIEIKRDGEFDINIECPT